MYKHLVLLFLYRKLCGRSWQSYKIQHLPAYLWCLKMLDFSMWWTFLSEVCMSIVHTINMYVIVTGRQYRFEESIFCGWCSWSVYVYSQNLSERCYRFHCIYLLNLPQYHLTWCYWSLQIYERVLSSDNIMKQC